MSIKQKILPMRILFIPCIILLIISSCSTTTEIGYSDPNYLESTEFSSVDNIRTSTYEELNTIDTATADSEYYSNDHYTVNNYYDYSYSSRIRRFHRPMYYSNYYGGIYTDYYWYNNNPFYCGTSIYYGYNWYSPYYSYYSYSPYYSYYSYSPYYYNYYHPYHYGNYYSYNNFNYNNNHTISGHRGSLSSYSNKRGVKKNINTIISNSNNSTQHIKNNHKNKLIIKNSHTNNNTYKTNSSNNSTIKTNIKKGNSSYTPKKSDSNKNSYSSPKSNTKNRSYKSRSSNNRNYKSGSNRSSRNSNNKSIKRRK